jgi:hypothetical protein
MLARPAFLILIATSIPLGCVDRSLARKVEIQQFALAYHNYHAAEGVSPARVEDLADSSEAFPNLYEQIRRGEFVVIWDAVLGRDGDENDKYVLGYEKNVPEQGGWVLRGGGSVRQVTPEQFRSLPKIKTTDNGAGEAPDKSP